MVVRTPTGFVNLEGCYDVRCRQDGTGDWTIYAVWATVTGGEATLYRTNTEADAERVMNALAKTASANVPRIDPGAL